MDVEKAWREMKRGVRKVAPWLFGIAAVAFVPFLLVVFSPDSLKDWLPAYWAGAAGGLMLELIGGAWGLELPSADGKPPADGRFAPFGPWIDIGFFGRMATGALAGPVFLILIGVLLDGKSNDELASIAGNFDTIAWSVLIGMASPVAWKVGETLVSARLEQVNTAVVAQHVQEAKDKLQDLANQPATQGTPDAQLALGNAIGKLESAQSLVAGGPPEAS